MLYHPEDFMNLSQAVELDGGKCLLEECVPKKYKIKQPDDRGRLRPTVKFTQGCGNSAKMVIPYDPKLHIRLVEDSDDPEPVTICESDGDVGAGVAKVCAVDDCVGLWPRYKASVTKRSYQPAYEIPYEFRQFPE